MLPKIAISTDEPNMLCPGKSPVKYAARLKAKDPTSAAAA